MSGDVVAPAGASAPTHTWEQAVEWLRAQPDQAEFVGYCYYDDPVLSACERFVASSEWRGVLELTRPRRGQRVVDIGAGRGLLSFGFARAGCDVTAIEPDPSPIVGRGAIAEVIRGSGLNIRVVDACAESLPLPNLSVDLVVCRSALHHARDIKVMCTEVARVLRPGGKFVAMREHVITRPEDLPAFLRSHPLHWLYGGENAYPLRAYQAAISGAGLRLERSLGPFDTPVNFILPMTSDNFGDLVLEVLERRLPGSLASLLASLPLVQRAYAASLTWRSDAPGRFYTFVARKP